MTTIKPFEKREDDIAELRRLAAMPQVGKATRTAIDHEIRRIAAGDAAEAEAAYELDFHFGGDDKRNQIVIHGLRLEVAGRVAQIDHLLINRFLDCYVIETKSFSSGISINEHGEFATFSGKRPVAVGSPIAQNARHIAVLKDAERLGLFANPTRLGIPIRMRFRPVIVIGKNGLIKRPEKAKKINGLERLIKTDQLRQLYDSDLDKGSSLDLAKVISPDSLEQFGRSIVRQHKPVRFDWAARFGIAPASDVSPDAPSAPADASAGSSARSAITAQEEHPNSKRTYRCGVCDAEVDNKVAFFCRLKHNKARFGGRILCREHQGKA